eukprot:10489372-Heterocapsa_arctica.AAC.1
MASMTSNGLSGEGPRRPQGHDEPRASLYVRKAQRLDCIVDLIHLADAALLSAEVGAKQLPHENQKRRWNTPAI